MPLPSELMNLIRDAGGANAVPIVADPATIPARSVTFEARKRRTAALNERSSSPKNVSRWSNSCDSQLPHSGTVNTPVKASSPVHAERFTQLPKTPASRRWSTRSSKELSPMSKSKLETGPRLPSRRGVDKTVLQNLIHPPIGSSKPDTVSILSEALDLTEVFGNVQ